ncbi:HEAT repeat domain-containing protein [Taylorella equigenitalis]|uniref:Leucine rich repeat variant n=2 Tax=Taylorella equigenitalis TaxID=29575 RepID=A0A654KFA5_TAYEM|nr:HEAT repeat domain-containing protein [Taylorella equigenitalis]ADU91108.1 Leucine rich repeat variant [Taylorella equigenitalis MCE9]AFN36212.1 hypothetical protein KUI_1147 [Taylorella equigenitalis ATCC 35865]ASY39613.1 hypothetical protein CA604_05745 [Taylorella equigenitalis]ASY42553.1 hypothetical protein CA943_05495 [Taylorella equigenitalis]KGK34120.1 hypothetical protein LW90_00740 [Taylorella equigenitalis]
MKKEDIRTVENIDDMSNMSEIAYLENLSFSKKRALIKDPNTSIKIIEHLSNDKDKWIRYAIACLGNLPSELVEKLANDSEKEVRRIIQNNYGKTKGLKI